MLSLPGKYFVMVAKSWGRAVSGPVLAVMGLILSAVQIKITDNQLAANVLKYCSWSTLAIAGLMIFVAQYEVWRDERSVKEALERRLLPKAIIRNLTPRVWPAGGGRVLHGAAPGSGGSRSCARSCSACFIFTSRCCFANSCAAATPGILSTG